MGKKKNKKKNKEFKYGSSFDFETKYNETLSEKHRRREEAIATQTQQCLDLDLYMMNNS